MSIFFRNFHVFRVIFSTSNKKIMIIIIKNVKKLENAQPTDPTWQVRPPIKRKTGFCFVVVLVVTFLCISDEQMW